jgi:hypothetical protein
MVKESFSFAFEFSVLQAFKNITDSNTENLIMRFFIS